MNQSFFKICSTFREIWIKLIQHFDEIWINLYSTSWSDLNQFLFKICSTFDEIRIKLIQHFDEISFVTFLISIISFKSKFAILYIWIWLSRKFMKLSTTNRSINRLIMKALTIKFLMMNLIYYMINLILYSLASCCLI